MRAPGAVSPSLVRSWLIQQHWVTILCVCVWAFNLQCNLTEPFKFTGCDLSCGLFHLGKKGLCRAGVHHTVNRQQPLLMEGVVWLGAGRRAGEELIIRTPTVLILHSLLSVCSGCWNSWILQSSTKRHEQPVWGRPRPAPCWSCSGLSARGMN